MNTTKATLALAKTLVGSGMPGGSGVSIPELKVCTPDGRTWEIFPVPAGRGRFADGHWGPVDGAEGGFRLFEVNVYKQSADEHDAVDGDVWSAGDLADYLRAVGQPKANASR